MAEATASRKFVAPTVMLAIIATAGALYFASDFFVPLTFGLVLTGLLWPVVQQLKRWRIPTAVGASFVVLGTVAILFAIIGAFAPPIKKFANEIPKTIAAARPKITALSIELGRYTGSTPATTTRAKPKSRTDSTAKDTLKALAGKNKTTGSLAAIDSATDSVSRDTSSIAGKTSKDSLKSNTQTAQDTTKSQSRNTAAAPTSPNAAAPPASAPANAPATIAHALGIATGVLGDIVEVILLALFILAAGDSWLKKLAQAIPNTSSRDVVIDTVTKMRGVVSRYLLATTIINIVQATIVAFALHMLGYQQIMLWGVLTFLLEFIPYFGGMVNIGLLFIAGLGAGKGIAGALSGPAAYLLITTVQNNVVSPIAYGRSLRLNPTAILAALMLWYMIWGVSGAFLAVPILAAFNVLADRVPSLKGIGAFISD